MIASKVLLNSYLNNNKIEDTDDYKLDRELSNKHTKIYNSNEGNLIFSARGTHNFIEDIPVDFSLLTGNLKHTKRFKKTQKLVDSAIEKHKPKNITGLGHSLGGNIINNLKLPENSKKITYNKGPEKRNPKGTKNYRSNNDPISLLNSNSKTISLTGGHGVKNNSKLIDQHIIIK